jgi:hypothetical protein
MGDSADLLLLAGADHATGAGGEDDLYGEKGDDHLDGGDGPDLLWGNVGDYNLDAGGDPGGTVYAAEGEGGEGGDPCRYHDTARYDCEVLV